MSKRPRSYHGMSHTRLYECYSNIRRRCEEQSCVAYPDYGGRGIKCMFESAAEFIQWAKASGYTDALTIDRIDSDGHYEPSNCRWITMKENQRNRTNNTWIEVAGKRKVLSAACEEAGLKVTTVIMRMKRGWPIERALGTPCPK